MDLEKVNKTENDVKQKKGLLKGISMMGACCLLPIIITTILPFISSRLGVTGTRIGYTLSSLICPIMMVGMIFLIGKESSCCSKHKENKSEK